MPDRRDLQRAGQHHCGVLRDFASERSSHQRWRLQSDYAIASDDGGTSNNVAIFLNNGSGVFTQTQVLSAPHAELASITTYAVGSTTDLAIADSADPASEYIVADVNSTLSLPETDYTDNKAISDTPTSLTFPYVDIDNLWSGKLPAKIKVGRRTALAVVLKNLRNLAVRTSAFFNIDAVDANNQVTMIGIDTVRFAAAANGRQVVSLPLTVPSTLVPGTYHIVVSFSYPDMNRGNNSVTSLKTFTL